MPTRFLSRFHDRSHRPDPGHDITIDGRASRLYNRLVPLVLRGFYRHVADEAASLVPPGGTVLDAGTGPGTLLVQLAKRRPDLRLTGIDLSGDMVALAERNLRAAGHGDRAEVRQADVADLPFPDASFDLVVSTFSMHHWAAITPAVTELARVLRPGGTLWIYDLRTMSGETLPVGEVLGGQPLRRTIPRIGRFPGRPLARWTAVRPATTAPADRS
jgi:ubiquinone/menaquinone biosynthesis C-methylase UbiE